MKTVAPTIDKDNLQENQAPSEIPSYPSQGEYVPVAPEPQPYHQEEDNNTQNIPVRKELEPTPIIEQVEAVPQSSIPEMHTNIERTASREGELAYRNTELGKSTFSGGVTTQQVVSQVSGYYTVDDSLISNPGSGTLTKTVNKGDPSKGSTWQATILLKILQTFWKVLGR